MLLIAYDIDGMVLGAEDMLMMEHGREDMLMMEHGRGNICFKELVVSWYKTGIKQEIVNV